jgi:hypothetical protein
MQKQFKKMKNLIKALADFQYEVPIIHKDTQGFNYSYADLPKIFSVITPILKKHKLCFTQLLEGDNLVTILYHTESGESLQSTTSIPTIELAKMNVYQSFGSGITYYRRYAISSMLGLVTDKDMDAAGEMVKNKIAAEKIVIAEDKLDDPIAAEWLPMIEAITDIEELRKIYLENKDLRKANPTIEKAFRDRKIKLSHK